jgi:hypothetical protein
VFEWNCTLYDEAGIAQLADRYLTLLSDAVQHRDRCVADLVEDEAVRLRARGSGLRAGF